MTGTHLPISDELLRRALAELAAGSDAGQLMTDVLRTVDVTPQAQPRWLDFGGRRTALLLLAAALLLLAALAGALALGNRPQPLPAVERTTNFNRPFEYVRPPGSDLELTDALNGLGLTRADALEMMRRLYGPCPETGPGGACSVGAFDSPLPLTDAEELEYAQRMDEWEAELSRLMASFMVGGPQGDRGVVVALPAQAPFGFSFWCFGPVESLRAPGSPEVLDLLRGAPWGQILPTAEAETFDGLPAASTRSPAGRCPTSHASERTGVVPQPGVVTLVQVNEDVVAVVIWGETDAILDEWLPSATEFVRTIHFIPEEA